jgi:hypothetical protein
MFEKILNVAKKWFFEDNDNFEMRRYVERLAQKYKGRVIWDNETPSSK